MVTNCLICNGLKHVDAPCHYCGAVKVQRKHFNVSTLREVVRGIPKSSHAARFEKIAYHPVNRPSQSSIARLVRFAH
jgi:hypothetical protein